ncbi:MAG TPA: hypothetical protein VJR89_17585 [Polyangiales bacterium]|nr:hypothetical protein [Polyangiales bacterium]
MRASPRAVLALGVFAVAFVINPGYFAGCVGEPSGPDFGEAEMLELLDEANATGPFDLEHAGVQYRLELSMQQKAGDDLDETSSRQQPTPFAARAYACGSRTFMASAAACLTSSIIPLTGQFSLVRIDETGETRVLDDETLSGELRVGGNRLSNGGAIEMYDAAMDGVIALRSKDGVHFELWRASLRIDGSLITF